MKKVKILKNMGKIALVLIIILIVACIIHTIRNYKIISNLQNNFAQYKDSKNYNISIISTKDTGVITKTNYYRKDNKQAIFLEKNTNGEIEKISLYDNGERVDKFIETKDEKFVQIDTNDLIPINVNNQLETDNNWQKFLGCVKAKIKSENYNGKDCYVITEFISSSSSTYKSSKIYVDKETGILLKNIEEGIVSERKYEFNKVENSIFNEPDISQYTIKEKN